MTDDSSDAKSIEKFLRELDVRIRARYPLIAINTYEEDRVREALIDLVFQEKHKEKPLYFWSRPTGLQKVVDPKDGLRQTPQSIDDTQDPESVLGYISEQKEGIFLLCDYAPYISTYGQEDPLLVRQLREIAWKLKSTKATVLFVGPNFPDLKLEKEITQIELELPKETRSSLLNFSLRTCDQADLRSIFREAQVLASIAARIIGSEQQRHR